MVCFMFYVWLKNKGVCAIFFVFRILFYIFFFFFFFVFLYFFLFKHEMYFCDFIYHTFY